jgi:oligo-alginate lyase
MKKIPKALFILLFSAPFLPLSAIDIASYLVTGKDLSQVIEHQKDTIADLKSSGDIPSGFFLPSQLVNRALKNAESSPQAAAMREEIIAAARQWLVYTDNQLWEMMFGSSIRRSWMVWSDGYCPSCKKGVPMYSWVMEPIGHPWKVRCPHCGEAFPKNDFEAYYRSGMNEHFVFDQTLADRSLLYNTEHPDAGDPLHFFGIDDGEGWVSDGHRWRFIGAYLIYGHWKELIHKGILRLSAAYAVTGDPVYSHRAGILLDRVADLYPTHDFGKQGVMYEGPPMAGYISTWHDACTETRQMALAFDMVRDALLKDDSLALFLSAKAKQYSIPVAKGTPSLVLKNIEEGILHHPLRNSGRIYSNYPQTDMTRAIIKSVLNGEGDRDSALIILDKVLTKSCSVDGVTGEKGLTGYTSYATSGIGSVLAFYSRADTSFLKELIRKHPQFADMFRFHIDLWCNQKYYPHIGDCSGFTRPDTNYVALNFSKNPGVNPSMYTLLWQLYKATGDPAFVQVLYHTNGDTTEGLPYDLFADSPEKLRREVESVISRNGNIPEAHSIDKKKWHLAVLKGDKSDQQPSVWLDYDSGGYHSHADGLNIGLFALGLDLLPDFGYPPVQFGGWASPRATWYTMTAAHNTVVVNGRNQRNLAGPYAEPAGFEGQPYGKTTLWTDGNTLRAVRAEAPDLYQLDRYERTIGMVSVSKENSYIFDLFRVSGGKDHARMTYSGFGSISTEGLTTEPSADYGYNTQLRNFRTDSTPRRGWSVDWKIEDRYKMGVDGEEPHLKLTDLTEGATVSLSDAWIAAGYNDTIGEWIPAVMTRRKSTDSLLKSDFVSILQPYNSQPFIASSTRLASDSGIVAVEVLLTDGRHDLWIGGGSKTQVQNIKTSDGHKITFSGELSFLRWSSDGSLSIIAIACAESIIVDDWTVKLIPGQGNIELQMANGHIRVASGSREDIISLTRKGKNVKPGRN